MTRDRAMAYLVNTLVDYINGYCTNQYDVSRITGEEGNGRPDREEVALLATALGTIGKHSVAERLTNLCK